MGNGHGKECDNMAMSALSHDVRMSKDELMKLSHEFHKIAEKSSPRRQTITKNEMQEALQLVCIYETDQDLLNRLFDLRAVEGELNFREFIYAILPILKGNWKDKLLFSFDLYDIDKSGEISPREMKIILTAMNHTINFFGDQNMSPDEIDALITDVYAQSDKSHTGKLNFQEYVHALVNHPNIATFVSDSQSI